MSDETHEHDHHHHDSEDALRTEALESLLTEKGLVDADTIDALVRRYETDIGPMNGSRLVARAWTDPGFKKRLLEDGASAIEEIGLDRMDTGTFQVVENRPDVHNVVVCTLCSCYPWEVLGLPPTWYKSPPYRARVVREPRAVLREFGLDLDDSVEVQIWDSSSELRYMVLPERPAGTEGLSEDELAALVGRDALIGVASVEPPR